MNAVNSGVWVSLLALKRYMDLRNGNTWTHFDEKGAIVSYANFRFGAQHQRARYSDGTLQPARDYYRG